MNSFRGPFVGNGSSSDDEPTIAMKRTRTQQPNVSVIAMLKALIPAALLILVVFWINAAHIYGLFRNQGAHVKGARVALADFDGGDFGHTLRTAAAMNSGKYGFPTYVSIDTVDSDPENIRREVFEGKYWAAIVVQPGASARFEDALNGTATSYDARDVYTYYTLSARYYSLYVPGIQSTTATIASTAATLFSQEVVAERIATGTFANTTAAASALAQPVQAVSRSAASQDYADLDTKIFINTLGAILPILMQFFFIMAWNGICNGMHLYAGYTLKRHIISRLFWSITFPCLSSLCVTGWTLALRGRYHINARIFFAYWTVTWVYSMISFDILDIITGFLPMPFVPFLMISWAIFNVAAALGTTVKNCLL
ncbi:hypothetical protein LEMA_P058970.1 [Plenodomus lingam JN3]|uniref:DUF3533 domain-containing protein n=1 Tax=Leptosphaeria maculans (strain JN3 / isolate v23.1.3 / race Av1-4-5-6-7-8) TaxID=985895 RepID=E4ZHN0_LEPMJ|nr:hypothetical protein LEMA_P058970.1 [Plenodomus lingam JN3]CBX90863.1 hypothetical protein LEMA_P058970.1 [Plenodomus lingam JN3]